ncbi:hypothetical protein BGX24_002630 [Mortierella sp. AD032]|nr:hypothetical protein BGX24_002630 [Mortierella sp. AD032]
MYYTRQGVPRNYSIACDWYLKAAQQGLAAAQLNIAELFWDKRVATPFDYRTWANDWCTKAADHGAVHDYSAGLRWYLSQLEDLGPAVLYRIGY